MYNINLKYWYICTRFCEKTNITNIIKLLTSNVLKGATLGGAAIERLGVV